jgi:hypothetical protein
MAAMSAGDSLVDGPVAIDNLDSASLAEPRFSAGLSRMAAE